MEKRNILLALLAVAFSLVVMRACEFSQNGHHPHEEVREQRTAERAVEVERGAPPPPPAPPEVAPPAHKVVGEDLYDGPDEARVEQILVVGADTDAEGLRALVLKQYAGLVEYAAFQHFEAPTDVTILVYQDRSEAANRSDAWIARLRMADRRAPEVEMRR